MTERALTPVEEDDRQPTSKPEANKPAPAEKPKPKIAWKSMAAKNSPAPATATLVLNKDIEKIDEDTDGENSQAGTPAKKALMARGQLLNGQLTLAKIAKTVKFCVKTFQKDLDGEKFYALPKIHCDRHLISWGIIYNSFDDIVNHVENYHNRRVQFFLVFLSWLFVIKYLSIFVIEDEVWYYYLGDFSGYVGVPRAYFLSYLVLVSGFAAAYKTIFTIHAYRREFRWLRPRMMLAGTYKPSEVGLSFSQAIRFWHVAYTLNVSGEVTIWASMVIGILIVLWSGFSSWPWPYNVTCTIPWALITSLAMHSTAGSYFGSMALFFEDGFYQFMRLRQLNRSLARLMTESKKVQLTKVQEKELATLLDDHRDIGKQLDNSNRQWKTVMALTATLTCIALAFGLFCIFFVRMTLFVRIMAILLLCVIFGVASSIIVWASIVAKQAKNSYPLWMRFFTKKMEERMRLRMLWAVEDVCDPRFAYTCLDLFPITLPSYAELLLSILYPFILTLWTLFYI